MTKSPHLTLMTSPAVVVKMSVTVIENSPSQAYSYHDDHTVQWADCPGCQSFTVLWCIF